MISSGRFHTKLLCGVFTLGSIVAGTDSAAQCEPHWIPGNGSAGLNSAVLSSCQWDPDGPGPLGLCLVVGGSFTEAGTTPTNGLAFWNGDYWQSIAGGPTAVTSLAVLPDGRLIAGGLLESGGDFFTGVGTFDGSTWATLGSAFVGSVGSPNAFIYAISTLESGELVVGGKFITASGTPVSNIAKWNGTNWTAIDSGLNGIVHTIIPLTGSGFVTGGTFTGTAGGMALNHIARWDGAAWSQLGGGMTSIAATRGVYSLAFLSNGDLIAGGTFESAGGVSAANIARWNGTTWSPLGDGILNTTLAPSVRALCVLPGDVVIAGGAMSSAGGSVAKNIAQWNGVSWHALGGGPASQVNCLESLPSGELIAGGRFTNTDGKQSRYIAKWIDSSWSAIGAGPAGVDDWIYSLAVLPNGNAVAGGNLTKAGVHDVKYIAQWNGAAWSPMSTGLNGTVAALAVAQNGDLIAGGYFRTAGNLTVNRVARWNGESWTNLGSGIGSTNVGFPLEGVTALAVLPNGDLVAGGNFALAGGIAVNNIARWNGSAWLPIGTGFSNGTSAASVLALAVLPGGDLVAGGQFTRAGGNPAINIARWDGATWSPMGAGMTGLPTPAVYCLLVLPNGELIAGGRFYYADSVNVNSIARWNGTVWSPLGTGVSGPEPSFPRVHALALLPDGQLAVAGYFGLAGGVPANNVARWDGSDWFPLAEGVSGASGGSQIRALTTLPQGELAVGGNFLVAGTEEADYWARWSLAGSPWIAVQPKPRTVIAGQSLMLAATPATGYASVSFQWRRNNLPVQDGSEGAAPGGGLVFGASGSFPFSTNGNSGILNIAGVTNADAGLYQVEFSNSCGEATSIPVEVKVKAHITDINADGQVDDADFLLFLDQYDLMLCADPLMPDACSADFNQDGQVDDADFGVFVPAYNAMLVN